MWIKTFPNNRGHLESIFLKKPATLLKRMYFSIILIKTTRTQFLRHVLWNTFLYRTLFGDLQKYFLKGQGSINFKQRGHHLGRRGSLVWPIDQSNSVRPLVKLWVNFGITMHGWPHKWYFFKLCKLTLTTWFQK